MCDAFQFADDLGPAKVLHILEPALELRALLVLDDVAARQAEPFSDRGDVVAIHLGAMAGTVDLVQRGRTGLEIRHGLLRLNPCVAPELQGLRLRVRYRGQWLEIEISCEVMTVHTPAGWTGPSRIAVHDEVRDFQPGDTLRFTCRPSHEEALPRTLAETNAG